MFKEFSYIPGFSYDSGWDKYALDYQNLLAKDTVYYLTKELIHHLIDLEVPNQSHASFKVLDVNCGTGNDFPFFFKRGWNITGCDGSEGMLNKASEKYESHIHSGQLKLYSGLIESLSDSDFGNQKFDLIFSVTGGFSYVNDNQLLNINHQFTRLLKPGGKLVVAHLNRFCLPETLHRIYQIKNPNLRKGSSIKVSIKGEDHTMFLRGSGKLKKIYTNDFQNIKLFPLLAITPPYQTGFKPGQKTLERLKKLEIKTLKYSAFNIIADQVVVVGDKKSQSEIEHFSPASIS